ncbi:MAG: EamA family transporter, partial [Planctomycetota bacterium]
MFEMTIGVVLLLPVLGARWGDLRALFGPGRRLAALAAAAGAAGYQTCFFAAVDRTGVALGTLVAVG